MTNLKQIIDRYAEQAGTDNPRFLRLSGGNVYVNSQYPNYREYGRDYDTIYSYGSHFPMARIMPDEQGNKRGWWLVNGDSYSVTTSKHQGWLRSAIAVTHLPTVILPFSALNTGGIDYKTIKLVEVLADRYTWEPRTRDKAPDRNEEHYSYSKRNFRELPDGRWAYEENVHHLGESLFTAQWRIRGSFNPDTGHYDEQSGTGYFLSAFDTQEGFGLYFLAQLPKGARPKTVAEAFEALKPQLVKDYEYHGSRNGPVLRQGDVFAMPTLLTTKMLPGPSQRSAYVLDTNHQATEVRTGADKRTYARGILRHNPQWRRPDHRRVPLGDRKTWYLLEQNTVPKGRSWSIQGNVD